MSRFGSSSPYADLDWRPWEIESLDAERRPAQTPTEPEPTVDMEAILAEVAELKELARQQGHAEGYAAGFDQGLHQGKVQGHADGFEAGHAAAVQQGHSEGYQAGSQQAAAECAQLATLVTRSGSALAELHEEVGQALLQLAVDIAKQVLQDELRQHPDHIATLVTQLLKDEEHTDQSLTVWVHPDDHAIILTHLAEDLAHHPQWRIKADDTISAGGLIIKTALGEVNATLQNRWRRVIARLGPIDTPPSAS